MCTAHISSVSRPSPNPQATTSPRTPRECLAVRGRKPSKLGATCPSAEAALAGVDSEEVPIVWREIPGRGAFHAGEQVHGRARAGSAVGDEAHPVGVDVELHRTNGAGMGERVGQAAHTLI